MYKLTGVLNQRRIITMLIAGYFEAEHQIDKYRKLTIYNEREQAHAHIELTRMEHKQMTVAIHELRLQQWCVSMCACVVTR